MSLNREIWVARSKKYKLRKNLFFEKSLAEIIKNFTRNMTQKKIKWCLWKIWRRAVLPCIYLRFDVSDENGLFLKGEASAFFSSERFYSWFIQTKNSSVYNYVRNQFDINVHLVHWHKVFCSSIFVTSDDSSWSS